MRIGAIQLLEFRNHRTLSWTPSPKLNLLSGANAQGKTNLLEALGFLLTGRSFRTARLAEIPFWGSPRAAVAGELHRDDGTRSMRRTITQSGSGTWQSAGDSCPWARAVAFGWPDLDIIHGPPVARRNFLDGFAARLYPRHRATLIRYRQVLARRNHLLQQGLSHQTLASELTPWDEQLAGLGVELIDRRRRSVAALQTELSRIYPALVARRHKVEIRYRGSLGEATEVDVFLAALIRSRRNEVLRGQTLVGPHRDDLVIELDGTDARTFGSRGQQRLLALALRLAEVLPITEATGTAPVLLLDDALSELDAEARASILQEVEHAEQVILTSPEQPSEIRGTRWRLGEGQVTLA